MVNEMINGKDTTFPLVYTASPYKHGRMWKDLRDNHPYPEFFAQWIDEWPEDEDSKKLDFYNIWKGNQFNVEDCDALIYYCEEGDQPEGALVEVGIALSNGIPVFVVDTGRKHRTWTYLRGIHHADSVHDAMFWIRDSYRNPKDGE